MSAAVLPQTDTLRLERRGWRLHVTLDRPRAKNAMSFAMLEELQAVFNAVAFDRSVRAVVIRGAEGNLCAGADVRDMAAARMSAPEEGQPDPLVEANRRFGRLLQNVEAAPQAVVVVAEGAVMGGGIGLLCVSDVALARADCRIRLPETSLGLTPAQIAPFVVRRVGLTEARRLAVTGGELDGHEAARLGLVHRACETGEELEAALDAALGQIGRCAPGAVARTKQLVLEVGRAPLDDLLDAAAADFAEAARGEEGAEGTSAFLEKRLPAWAQPGT